MAPTAAPSTLGPGLLTIGETGSTTEFGVMVSEVTLEPDFDSDDPIVMLSGDEYAGDESVTWTLKPTIYQTYDKDSLILFTHQHAGEEMPFTFVPDKAGVLQAKGKLKMRPASIGGEVKKRNTSELEFPVVGTPQVDGSYTA